ncbi:hypothetical protein PG989_003281 [Apiospora arundinis]|uniref:Uncharacterized protein n=1 Tax=Apiospora arundinis TaxID=335852 RepID=A0ABR2I1T1_9PEZI
MPSASKKAKTFTPPGFLFENDPRPSQGYFRNILHSHQYMPGDRRPATPEWNKARVEVNLSIVFEAIWHFSDFLDVESFWYLLAESLKYHENIRGPQIQRMAEVYCEGRKEYLQKKREIHMNVLAPHQYRLLELVDLINELPREERTQRPLTDWDLLKESWDERLQVVLREFGCLADDSGQGQTSSTPVEVQKNPNGKRPSPSEDGDGSGDAGREKKPFFFDLNGGKGTAVGDLPKRPALEKDVLGPTGPEQLIVRIQQIEDVKVEEKVRVDKMDSRLHVVEELAAHLGAQSQVQKEDVAKVEAGLQGIQNELGQYVTSRDHETTLEARQRAVQEEMKRVLDGQTKEATAQWEAIQVQLKAMQVQLKEHEDAIANHASASTVAAPPSFPAPSVDSSGRDLSEMLAYQPREFVEAICGELNKLRAITKSKIHQMDKQGLPDDEKKLAVSDLSWQIGKCIKVAEKGVNGLA